VNDTALERLRRLGEPFMEELSRAHWRAGAGYTSEIELQPIFDKHAAASGRESLELTLDAFRTSVGGSDDARAARALLDWQVESHTSRALAALEEREIAWEHDAVVNLPDGRAIPYQRAAIEIANSTDRDERIRIDAARAALVARELGPLRRERFQREHDLVAALEIAPSYIDAVEVLGGVELRALGTSCAEFLRTTQSMWDDALRERLKRDLGIMPSDATRSDALALARAPYFDRFFGATAMEATVRRQLTDMGIDPEASGRIRYDTVDREGKRSRAFCAPVRIPDEVHLVMRPQGGVTDWMTLLHELGHALHFANMRTDLPFEYRWLGDNSVTEGYAMLFDHRLQDAGWLRRYTSISGEDLGRFLRVAGYEELRFLRRYAAKLVYELDLHGGEVPWDELPGLYADRLTAATGFQYSSADAFVDVDPRFYAARYLQAWQLQSVLAEALVERFDDDWWRNPRAGPWITQNLFAEGQRELAHELALRAAGRELSFAPLIRSVERLLQS
jgi:hypothetical protein